MDLGNSFLFSWIRIPNTPEASPDPRGNLSCALSGNLFTLDSPSHHIFFSLQRCMLFKSFCSLMCPSWILRYFLGWLQILVLANFFFFFFLYHYWENRCEADDQLTQMPLLWQAPGRWDFQIFFFLDMDHLKKINWICYTIVSILFWLQGLWGS